MKEAIKKVPLPLSGVMLAFAALGNLLQSYGEGIRTVCGIVSALLLLLLLLKLILFPKMIAVDLKTPIMAGVAATFPMGLMLLSTYIKPFKGSASQGIWFLAIALHVVLIFYFTAKFLLHFDSAKTFAVYFIVYVGIAVGAVTSPAYGMQGLGTILFWFALVCFVFLFFLITYAYLKTKKPDPAQPLICIYAAPLSLCVAGYVQAVTPKNYTFLVGMYVVSLLIYVFALYKAVGFLMKSKFFPSWAAFTFPFVISAIAAKQTAACAASMERQLSWISPVVNTETVIAVVFCVYVLVRFVAVLRISSDAHS